MLAKAAARAGYVVAQDKKQPKRRLFLPVKNNLGCDHGGLAYSIIESAVAWERDAVSISADEALAPDKPQGNTQGNKRTAEQSWLKSKLAGGPKPAADVLADGAKQASRKKRSARPSAI